MIAETIEVDFKDIIKEIDYHLFRAGWSKEKARNYLIFQYHKRSRRKLTDDELLEFLATVKDLPSQYPLTFRRLVFPDFPPKKIKQVSF